MKKELAFNAVVYAFIVIFAVVCIIPYLWVFLATFKSTPEIFQNPFGLPQRVRFGNYPEAWTTGRFGVYYKNSLIITILAVAIMVPAVALAAYPLAKMDFYGRKIILSIFLIGLVIPFYAIMISLYYRLRDFRLLDTYLAMVLPRVALGIPFGVFMMRSYFVRFPTSLLDAARIDGCSEFSLFTKVVLPVSRPAVVSLGIFQTVWTWNDFLIPLLYTQSDWIRPITLGMMFFEGRYTTDYALTMTGCILISFPLLVAFLVFQRGFIRGLVSGAFR